jgi:hypothetical protein
VAIGILPLVDGNLNCSISSPAFDIVILGILRKHDE